MKRRGISRPQLDFLVDQSVPNTQGSTSKRAPIQMSASFSVSKSGSRLDIGPLCLTSHGIKKNSEDAASPLPSAKCNDLSELDLENRQLIGRGSSGRVYSVLHIPSGIHFCMKQIAVDEPRQRKEVEREIDVLASSHSKHIVSFVGAYYHSELNSVVVLIELMQGSLHDAMRTFAECGKVLTEEEVRAFALQILCGLNDIHVKNIIHRDIKPANVLFNRAGEVKLADFGISKLLRGEYTSTFCGSVAYMSPDRLEGKEYGRASDVWSLGVVLFEAAAGLHPFCSDSDEEMSFWTLRQRITKPHVDLSSDALRHHSKRTSNLSDGFAHFLGRCLKAEPSRRGTVVELLNHPWLASIDIARSKIIVASVAAQLLNC